MALHWRANWRLSMTSLYAWSLIAILISPNVGYSEVRDRSDIGFDQKLNGQIPLDLVFEDSTGKEVRLGDYFGEKPVIVMPVFYRCPLLCGLEMNGFVRGLRGLEFSTKLKANKDFLILTYSMDPEERPTLADQKRKQYLVQYGNESGEDGWQFLTGTRESIEKLNDAIGFKVRQDPVSKDFEHAAGLLVCTPDGVISRYLLGIEFAPRDLQLSILEASAGQIAQSINDKIMMFCYRYDPSVGKYGLAIMNLLRAAGVSTVLILVSGIIFMMRRTTRVSGSQRRMMEGTTNE